jgi:hypothetical protein
MDAQKLHEELVAAGTKILRARFERVMARRFAPFLLRIRLMSKKLLKLMGK